MKKVRAEKPYLSEKAKKLFPVIDFVDTFSTTNNSDDLEKVSKLIFDSQPKWVDALFEIRNWIANLLGLKTTIPDDYHTEHTVGGYIGFFKIYSIDKDELIMGADDKHLNFRAVINNENTSQYNIKVTTIVQYNNKMGKVYMTFVKPFHRLVIMAMIKKAYKKL